MDKYEQWDRSRKNHGAGAFHTDVLRQIELLLPDKVERTAETGCGKSTILFSNISSDHRVFALDDREYGEMSSVSFFETCPLSIRENVTFLFGPTQLTLRRYEQHEPYDTVLLDGPHGFPFPEFEYMCFYPNIRTGGILIVDDVSCPTIGRMCDFLAEDEMWEVVGLVRATAIFRRTKAPTFDPTGDGWWLQRYNRRRVSSKREIFLSDGPVEDCFTTQKLDLILQGEDERYRELQKLRNDLEVLDQALRDSEHRNAELNERLSTSLGVCEQLLLRTERSEAESLKVCEQLLLRTERSEAELRRIADERKRSLATRIKSFIRFEAAKFLCTIGLRETGTELWKKAKERRYR